MTKEEPNSENAERLSDFITVSRIRIEAHEEEVSIFGTVNYKLILTVYNKQEQLYTMVGIKLLPLTIPKLLLHLHTTKPKPIEEYISNGRDVGDTDYNSALLYIKHTDTYMLMKRLLGEESLEVLNRIKGTND